MKTPQFLAAGLALAGPFLLASSGFGQGDLNPPPGPPAPTMKSLDQIEPRTPVDVAHTPGDATSMFIISAPGSYYLTGNITGVSGQDGIRIASDNVTLDLSGFVLIGVSGSLHGITVPAARTNVTIRNGTVRNWGQKGVDAALVSNGTLESLSASNNGTAGLAAGLNCRVSACVALNNTGEGITFLGGCTIKGCSVQGNYAGLSTTDLGGGSDITGCTAFANTTVGISAFFGNTVSGCTTRYNGNAGIGVSSNCTVSGCTSSRNTSNGITAFSRNLIVNNSVSENGQNGVNGDGINCYGGENRIDSNHATGNNGRGIRSTGGVDIIIRNTSLTNSAGAYAPGTSSIGPIGNPATATSPWANF